MHEMAGAREFEQPVTRRGPAQGVALPVAGQRVVPAGDQQRRRGHPRQQAEQRLIGALVGNDRQVVPHGALVARRAVRQLPRPADLRQARPGAGIRDEEHLPVLAKGRQGRHVRRAQRAGGVVPAGRRQRSERRVLPAPFGQHERDAGQRRPRAGRQVPDRVLEGHGRDGGGIRGRVAEREPAAEGLAQHGPAPDAQCLAHRLAVVDQVGDGQRGPARAVPVRGQRRGPVHAALVQADQPDRRGEQVTLQGHEVVAALPGPAVQEQQRRGIRVAADVGVQLVLGDPAAVRAIGAHGCILAQARAAVAGVRGQLSISTA